jgi:glycosyltransferase involved in cell wall biosynthesis
MKRILIFSPFYPPHLGGLETYVYELSAELARAQYAVTVFTSNITAHPAPPLQPGVTVVHFPAWEIVANYPVPRLWQPAFWRTLRQVLTPQPDYIISNTRFFLTSLLAGIVAKWLTIPWVHIEHGSWFVSVASSITTSLAYLYDHSFGRVIFHSATVTVAISQAVQGFVRRFDGRPTVLMYRGLNTALLDTIALHYPPSFTPPPQTLVLVSVGRLLKWKGFQYTIDAVQSLVRTENLKITLLVVGDGEDRLLLERSASSSIIFTGPLSYPATIAVLKAADIYIHSALRGGGLSTALLEAMYCGRAVIATPHEGAREVVINEQTGLVVPAANSAIIAQAILRLQADQPLRTQLGMNAHRKVRPMVAWENSSAKFTALFDQLARNANRTV